MAMSGNGAKIIGIATIKERLRTVAPGYPLMRVNLVFAEAVPGSPFLGLAAPRTAALFSPAAATTVSVFGFAVRPPGLFRSPFPSFPLALFLS